MRLQENKQKVIDMVILIIMEQDILKKRKGTDNRTTKCALTKNSVAMQIV